MPLDAVIKIFLGIFYFGASCYRVHPPAKFFLKIRNFFWDRSIGSFYKNYFLSRGVVASWFEVCSIDHDCVKFFCLVRIFLSAAHRLQHRIVLALRVDAPGCRVYSGPQNRRAYHDQVIQPGSTPFKLFFCWYRSLKGSGRNFFVGKWFRLITFIIHSKTFHNESAVCSDPLNLFKGPLAVPC